MTIGACDTNHPGTLGCRPRARARNLRRPAVTLQVWGGAALLVAASVLLGRAVDLLGARCKAAAPAVGLSLLVLIASIAIKLPGRATTAAVILVLVLIAAGVVVVRRGSPHTVPVVQMRVAAVAALGAAVPFIANGRVGILGVSLDNDTATHLILAEELRTPVTQKLYGLPSGYPLGPHSVAAALGSGLGIRLDLAFTALMIATVIVTALVGAAALRHDSAWKQVVVGVLAALFYLVAAFYAEGAFKEPMFGLLLLAMVLHLEEVGNGWAQSAARWRALLPVSLLAAGAVYVYSYLAFAWIGLTLVIWLAAEVAVRPRWFRHWRARTMDLALPAVTAAAVMLVLLVPVAGRVINFAQSVGVSPAGTGAISGSNLGNLAHSLSGYEALGLWQNADFRFLPANVFHQGELSALALGVLVLGLAWSVARRELVLPAAVLACAIIFWRSGQSGQSPYVTAKALVIAGPVVAVTGLRGLLRTPAAPMPRWLGLAKWGVAAAFVLLAANSSYEVLRNEPVWPAESTSELLSLDKLTSGHRLLFLGNSDYAAWLFHDSQMSALAGSTISLSQASPRSGRPFVYGTALDFDSVDPATINLFRWVITSNTTYASQPPEGFRLVRRLPMYELWQRVGHVPARQVLEPVGAPGAVLNCRQPSGRALSRRRGIASVMATPISLGLSPLAPGGAENLPLRLPAGRWDLSLQYVSPVVVALSAGGQHWRMPPYLDRPGPVFAVGSLASSGAPITLTVRAERPSFMTGPNLVAFTTTIVATRSPDTRVLVPLSRSCGRYVDWYRLSA
jgi:hypothetical protein